MRIVCTGARGFIGSVFARRASELGHSVIAVDDESRGLNEVEAVSGVRYIKHDCRMGLLPVVPLLGHGIDAVAHFAAATGSLERPYEELYDLNVRMAQTVYEDALRLGAKAFAWPTTSLALEVPDSSYVRSKEEALRVIHEVDTLHNIAVPVRLFNVAGCYKGFTERRKREVHVIPRLVDCHQRNKPFTINGTDYDTRDGSPSRDLVNVVNVVDYLLYMINKRMDGHELPFHDDGAIWIGTGRSLTVRQMIVSFEDHAGHVEVQLGPRRPFDCGALNVDPGQAATFRQVIGEVKLPEVSFVDEAVALSAHRMDMVG